MAYGTETTGLVGLDLTDDISSHLLEFVQKLLRLKLATLYLTQFLLPDTRQFGGLNCRTI